MLSHDRVRVALHRTPWLDRLFIDPFASVAFFGEIESYINGNPDFPNQDVGRNSSSEHNLVKSRATASTTSPGSDFTT